MTLSAQSCGANQSKIKSNEGYSTVPWRVLQRADNQCTLLHHHLEREATSCKMQEVEGRFSMPLQCLMFSEYLTHLYEFRKCSQQSALHKRNQYNRIANVQSESVNIMLLTIEVNHNANWKLFMKLKSQMNHCHASNPNEFVLPEYNNTHVLYGR